MNYTEFKTMLLNKIIKNAKVLNGSDIFSYAVEEYKGTIVSVIYKDEWHDRYEGSADIKISCTDEVLTDAVKYFLDKKYNTIYNEVVGEDEDEVAYKESIANLAEVYNKLKETVK